MHRPHDAGTQLCCPLQFCRTSGRSGNFWPCSQCAPCNLPRKGLAGRRAARWLLAQQPLPLCIQAPCAKPSNMLAGPSLPGTKWCLRRPPHHQSSLVHMDNWPRPRLPVAANHVQATMDTCAAINVGHQTMWVLPPLTGGLSRSTRSLTNFVQFPVLLAFAWHLVHRRVTSTVPLGRTPPPGCRSGP